MIYLASPYSSPSEKVMQRRYDAACRAVADHIVLGYVIYSPILNSHPLRKYDVPGDWKFWASVDLEFLVCCDELWVLTLPGWRKSVGVAEEIRQAREWDIPITYVEPRGEMR